MIYYQSRRTERGFSFIDTIIGVALMTIVFFTLFSAFRYSLVLLGLAKAKISAIALANEQMEYIRSIEYDSIGTLGGIPAGLIPQTETFDYNNIDYTRRVLVTFEDSPADGLDDLDANAITADYKRVKVEISWTARGRNYSYSIISTIVPKGVETISGGGTLRIYVVSALGTPIASATVRIQNSTAVPPIDVTVSTNASGRVEFPGGTPAGSGYKVTVSKTGYSTAGTYDVSVGNPNPSPGHLTVSEGDTTTATFAIDAVSSLNVRTFEPVDAVVWSDSFTSTIHTSLRNLVTVSGGEVTLEFDSGTGEYAPSGEVRSESISPQYLDTWNQLSFSDDQLAGTQIVYRVYYYDGASYILIPEADLPGNAAGFTTSPIDLSGLAIATYDDLRLSATLETAIPTETPTLLEWELSYNAGPTPLPNIDFSISGAKTIGTDSGGAPIAKYSQVFDSGASAGITLQTMEWDNYTITPTGSFTITESCPPQPLGLAPGVAATLDLSLIPSVTNSLLVSVYDNTGALVSGANVRLMRGALDITKTSSSCGQTFFSASAANDYILEVSKTGFQTTTIDPVSINGATVLPATLVP